MVPQHGFMAHEAELLDYLKELRAEGVHRITQEVHGREIPMVLMAKKVNGKGDIEIVNDNLGDRFRRKHPRPPGPRVWDVGLQAEDPVHILAKKFDRLVGRTVERDHYDIVWAACYAQAMLIETVRKLTTPEQIGGIALRAQDPADELFKHEEKPVVEPKMENWKERVAGTWRAIATIAGNPNETRLALPPITAGTTTGQSQGHEQ